MVPMISIAMDDSVEDCRYNGLKRTSAAKHRHHGSRLTVERNRRGSDQLVTGALFERLVLAGTILTVVTCLVCFTVHSVQAGLQRALDGIIRKPCVVSVTVKPGDTLWHFARKYGAPSDYILDNVDAIAQDNGINPDAPLAEGRHLRIRVGNPILLATLGRDSQVARAD